MTRLDSHEWTPRLWLVLVVLGVALAATPRACDQQMAFYDLVTPVQVLR
jgi:hypothetical protein